MLYVNNSSISVGNLGFDISASDIQASQSLVNTYTQILMNRTTLERVIYKTQLDYSYSELYSMVEASQANETEIMRVTVTTEDPYESAKIANAIAEVLPTRIAEIIDGAHMEVVDHAVPNHSKVAPSVTIYTVIGFLLGVLGSGLLFAILAILDDTIHNEEYILQRCECPVLAKIPELTAGSNGSKYGYSKYGYYYKRHTSKKD
jgi:capsular polysaccharide biosynthesis protein